MDEQRKNIKNSADKTERKKRPNSEEQLDPEFIAISGTIVTAVCNGTLHF